MITEFAMIVIISLFIGFFIGYLTATLVNVARDYEMPEIEQDDLIRNHESGTRKGWAKEASQQMTSVAPSLPGPFPAKALRPS